MNNVKAAKLLRWNTKYPEKAPKLTGYSSPGTAAFVPARLDPAAGPP
jgi:hypothetical protein